MQNKMFGMISLARKAGKLIGGFDAVKESVMKGEAQAVLYSSDVSPRTKRSMSRAVSQGKNPPVELDTELSMYDYGAIFGKATGVMALTDKNFTEAISNLKKEEL